MADGVDVATLKMSVDASSVTAATGELNKLATANATVDAAMQRGITSAKQQAAANNSTTATLVDQQAAMARIDAAIARGTALAAEAQAAARYNTREMVLLQMKAIEMDEAAVVSHTHHTIATGRLAQAYGHLASELTGVNHTVLRTGEAFGSVVTGHMGMLALMIGVVAVGKAWEMLNEETHKNAEEMEEVNKKWDDFRKTKSEVSEIEHEIVKLTESIHTMNVEMDRAKEARLASGNQARGGAAGVEVVDVFAPNVEKQKQKIDEALENIKAAVAERNRLIAEAEHQATDKFWSDIASLITSKNATQAELAAARQQLAHAQEELASHPASMQERLELQARISLLKDALGITKQEADLKQQQKKDDADRLANYRDAVEAARQVAERREAVEAKADADRLANYRDAVEAARQVADEADAALVEAKRKREQMLYDEQMAHAKAVASLIAHMWKDIQRDMSKSVSSKLGGGLVGAIGGDVFGAGLGQVLRDTLTPAFDKLVQPIKDALGELEKSVVQALGGKATDGIGEAVGGWVASNPLTALGIGGGVLAAGLLINSLGVFDDTAKRLAEEQARYTAAMVSATNELKSFTQRASGVSGNTYADSIKKLNDEFWANWTKWRAEFPGIANETFNKLVRDARKALDEGTARLTANERTSLTARGLAANGKQGEADTLLFAMKQQQEAADYAAANADAVTTALLKQAQAAERAAFVTARFAQVLDSLGAFQNSLKLSNLTTLTPGQQVAEARTQYETTLAKARAGDQAAALKLPDVAQQYLTLSRSYNASGTTYAADFSRVQSDTAAVIALFEQQKTQAQQALDEAVTSNTLLSAGFGGVIDGITGLRGDINTLTAMIAKQGESGGLVRVSTIME